MYFVITDMAGGAPVNQAACNTVRDEYGLEMTVLYDKDNVLNTELGMRVNTADMVVTQGNVIDINGPWAIQTVENSLQKIFGY